MSHDLLPMYWDYYYCGGGLRSSYPALLSRIGTLLGAFGLLCASAQGAVKHLSANADFQKALDEAVPGDTLVLAATGTYSGNFVLRAKQGNSFITIQSSALNSLPPQNQRVSPGHRQSMPNLISPNSSPVIRTADGAHHYRFVGIEFGVAPNVYNYALIRLGSSSATSADAQPNDLIFDRVYVHGDPTRGGKRGLELNSRSTTVSNSYFSDFKSSSQETQAIGGWNGPGPFLIFNNYLEASGVAVMFGGAAPKIPNLVPSNITFHNNYVSRPLGWKGKWLVKNLFELKNARYVDASFNVFENNWVSGQNGTAILFTVRTCESGDYPWAAVEKVTFSNNVVRKAEGGGIVTMGNDDVRTNCATPGTGQVRAAGTAVTGQGTVFKSQLAVGRYLVINKVARRIVSIADNTHLTVSSQFSSAPVGPASFSYFSVAGRVSRILIQNNVFEDIRPLFQGSSGGGRLFQVYSNSQNVTIDHNTGFQSGLLLAADGAPSSGLIFTNNIAPHNSYGIKGSGTATGNATINRYLPGAKVTNNIMVGGAKYANSYPAGNFFPDSMNQVGFVNFANDNYALAATSPYKGKALGGGDPGMDMDVISQVLQEAVSGVPTANGPSISNLTRRVMAATAESASEN